MSEIEQILIPLGISLITVFVAFLIKWKHDKTTLEDKKDKAISNLMLEIKTTVDFIRKNPVHYEITSEGVGKARNIELDTAFYDSLVTSGLFEEYDQDFQVELSSLYTIIKSSNQRKEQDHDAKDRNQKRQRHLEIQRHGSQDRRGSDRLLRCARCRCQGDAVR